MSYLSAEKTFGSTLLKEEPDLLELTLRWGDTLLAVRHLEPREPIVIGESPACALSIPAEVLGAESFELARTSGFGMAVFAPNVGSLTIDGAPADGGLLTRGHRARVQIGSFAVEVALVDRSEHLATALLDRLKDAAIGPVLSAAAMHGLLFAAMGLFAPAMGADDLDAIDRERLHRMSAFLDAAAERSHVADPTSGSSSTGAAEAASGGRAVETSGAMGTTEAHSTGRWAIKGDARPQEVTFDRERDRAEATNSAMIQLVGLMSSTTLNKGPVAPWGSIANGSDRLSASGDFWSTEIGDAFGTGLGWTGDGPGGDGNNLGVGVRDIGGLGRSLAARDGTCSGTECGPGGLGNGHGHVGGAHVSRGPVIHESVVSIDGTIPREVIQRAVRQNFGRFRSCYEAGLRTNPSLSGRVAVKFVIDRNGSVSLADDGGSDLPDASVRACVVHAFYNLSFPEPKNGSVRVVYPILFSPSDA